MDELKDRKKDVHVKLFVKNLPETHKYTEKFTGIYWSQDIMIMKPEITSL